MQELVIFISVLLPVLILAFFLIYITSGYARYEVVANNLRIYGLYGRKIPKDLVIKEGIEIMNLNEDSKYIPSKRTNGIGLPGYYEGWFKLKNGEKALILLRGKLKTAVYIPTKENFSLILGSKDPDALIKSIMETK